MSMNLLNQVIDELYDELSALKQEFKREMRLIKIENSNLKRKSKILKSRCKPAY